MSASPATPLPRQWPVLVALAVFCLILNGITLWDFHPRMAGRGDDNVAYYARRAVAQEHYPGDVHHNKLQFEYILFSAPNWLSYGAIRLFGVESVDCAFFWTLIKPWVILFGIYFFVISLTKSPIGAALTAVVVLSAHVLPINLAVFGILLEEPYQSDFTYPLILVVFAFLFRQRLTWALVTLLGLALIHPSMSLVCYALLMAVMVGCWRDYTLRQKAATALMGLPVLACAVVPANLVLHAVGAENLGTARDMYDSLNETVHGQMWESAVWLPLLLASFRILGLLIPVFVSPTFAWDRNIRILLVAIGAALVMTLAGLFAKQVCIWTYDSPWLSIAIRFHQLFLPRISSLVLIFTISLAVPHFYSIITTGSSSLISRSSCILLLLLLLDRAHPFGVRADAGWAGLLFPTLTACLALSEISTSSAAWLSRGYWRTLLAGAALVLLAGALVYLAYQIPFMADRRRTLLVRMIPVVWCLAAIAVNIVPARWTKWLSRRALSTEPSDQLPASSSPALFSPSWSLILVMVASIVTFAALTLWRVGVQFQLDIRVLGLALVPLFVWFAVRRPQVAGAVFLVLACVIQVHSMLYLFLPADHPSRAWHATAVWARENTAKETSFLMVMDYRERPHTWCAWRTYAERGFVPLFEPAWPLVYIPDLRNLKFGKESRAYFAERYPGHDVSDYFDLMDADDLRWLRDATGARYAIGRNNRPLPAECIFRNGEIALYDLSTLPNDSTHPSAASQKVD